MMLPTYSNRPFLDVKEMNSELIRRWNEKVPKDGIVFFLGDFAWGKSADAQYILEQLNGKIHLIIGNHEKTVLKKEYTRKMFESIQYYVKIRVGDKDAPREYQEICLMHYPILSWDQMHHGSWHLFGHSHYYYKHHTSHGLDSNMACIDVGVDCDYTNYAPLSYYEIKDIILKKIAK
jgi:calcineurin-like phosphoesterase family protein